MTGEIGQFCLILAGVLSLLHVPVYVWLSRSDAVSANRLSHTFTTLQFAFISLAFAALILARAVSDFSVLNVAEHSSLQLPMLYKITGAWGNHEGSMLLWVWVLALFALLFARLAEKETLTANALALHAVIMCGFVWFILFTSNPFTRIFPPPFEGEELNPLLQDIGLAAHPPVLYLGYVGFSVVFALAVAALLAGRVDQAWARIAKPWILFSWIFLTLGIGLGSWWAYRELGWGGYWFWDPVENASLLPWLAGTALLHSNIALQKRGVLASWVLLLAIFTFSLSLLGTFLVRSGLLTSVHSFASDPLRGYFILGYITIATGGALLLYALRAPRIPVAARVAPLTREGAMVINNLFLITACLTVLLGTMYPLLAEFLLGQKITVGAPYFNATVLPLVGLPLVLGAIAPFLPWERVNLSALKKEMLFPLVAVLAALLLVFILVKTKLMLALLGFGLSAHLAASTLKLLTRQRITRSLLALVAAHLGAALVVAGVTGSGLFQQMQEKSLQAGDTLTLGAYVFTLEKVEKIVRPNHTALAATFALPDGKRLTPEYRSYAVGGANTSETALWIRPFYDVYLTVGERQKDGRIAVRAYQNPMMSFLWAGFILMGIGGALALRFQQKD